MSVQTVGTLCVTSQLLMLSGTFLDSFQSVAATENPDCLSKCPFCTRSHTEAVHKSQRICQGTNILSIFHWPLA